MNDDTAAEVIQFYMQWTDEERHYFLPRLQRMAAYKFDSYEQFLPGERFFERLARWLGQATPADRRIMVDFILRRLIFISRVDMAHVIASAWPDTLRPWLRTIAAEATGMPPHRVTKIEASPDFQRVCRETLIVGVGDGARLDVLRRHTPFSHEQFRLTPDFDTVTADKYRTELKKALDKYEIEDEPMFRQVVLVDDFYGSGTSLIKAGASGAWEGKLPRFVDRMSELGNPLLTADYRGAVMIYIASNQAAVHIGNSVRALPRPWTPLIGYVLPASAPVHDPATEGVCARLYDTKIEDEIKGECMLGYKGTRLPAVLSHNTPNNSLALLWADTVGVEGSLQRHALFPRYERHHPDRP